MGSLACFIRLAGYDTDPIPSDERHSEAVLCEISILRNTSDRLEYCTIGEEDSLEEDPVPSVESFSISPEAGTTET